MNTLRNHTLLVVLVIVAVGIASASIPRQQNLPSTQARAPSYAPLIESTTIPASVNQQVGSGGFGGGVGGAGGGSSNLYPLPNYGGSTGRVVQSAEGIVGNVNRGQFQAFTYAFVQSIANSGGYVNSSNITLDATGTWTGVWNVNIPTKNTTSFLFNSTNIITQYGHVESLNTQTHDVTAQTKGNQSAVPYTSFGVTINELRVSNAPLYVQAVANLEAAGSVILYLVIIFVPSFLGLLAFAFLSTRIFIPLIKKAGEKGQRTSAT